METFTVIFNLISGLCSILGFILTIITINKVNQIFKILHIGDNKDFKIKKRIKQENKGNLNINYNGGDKIDR